MMMIMMMMMMMMMMIMLIKVLRHLHPPRPQLLLCLLLPRHRWHRHHRSIIVMILLMIMMMMIMMMNIMIKVRDQRGILGSCTDGLHWQHLLWRNHGGANNQLEQIIFLTLYKTRYLFTDIPIADCQVHPAAPTMSGLGDYLEIAILQPGTGTSTTVSYDGDIILT